MDIWVISNAPLNDEYWLFSELNLKKHELNIDEVHKIQSSRKASEYRRYGKLGWFLVQILQIKLAYNAMKKSDKNDILITESYPTGRHCAVLSTLFRQERKILALNCLQSNRSKIMKIVDRVIDYLAWKNKKFVTSVNVESSIEELSIPEYVKKERKIYVIPDTYIVEDKRIILKEQEHTVKKYDGMMGGYANRDFSLFFELAKKNSSFNFACIVGSTFKKNEYYIPDNVELFRDVSETEFIKIMNMSKTVLIPLLDETVAGLVVLKQAISYRIPFIVSDIPAVINYIPKEVRDYVLTKLHNIDDFNNKFCKIYNSSVEWDEKASMIDEYASRWKPQNKISLILDILYEEHFV